MKLLLNAVAKFVLGFILVGFFVFLPAGTLDYINGWLFLTVLFVPILIMGILLFVKAPNLLKKRLNGKEKRYTQKGVVAFSGLVFVLGFIVAGLDYRFGWSKVSKILVCVAVVLFLISYLLYSEVLRENAYLSRTIDVEENQMVIDTGLYSVVRHPMYMSTIIMFLSIPLILGSFWSLLIFSFYPIIIYIRIKDEETVLSEKLKGYSEYKKKVKYRLIPFIW